MKTSELRLGNYIKQKSHPTKYKINAITKGGGWIELTDGFEECDSDIDSIEPIQLTEDILVKCGAIKLPTKSGFAASYKLGSITINRSSFGNYYYKKNVYNTLHKIQNLYHALEQEELNIIL